MTSQIAIAGWEFADVPGFLSMCAAVGADAVEPAPWNIESVGVSRLGELAVDLGLGVSCVSTGIDHRFGVQHNDDVRSFLTLCIENAAILHAPLVTTYVGGQPDADPRSFVDALYEGIAPCAGYAAERGIQILIENVFDTTGDDPTGRMLTRNIDGCRLLLEALSDLDIGMTIDPCNFLVADQDPGEAFDVLRGFISNFHVKDAVRRGRPVAAATNVTWTDSTTGVFDGVHSGQGDCQLQAIIRRALDDGFEVPLTIEHAALDVTGSGTEHSYRTEVDWVRQQISCSAPD